MNIPWEDKDFSVEISAYDPETGQRCQTHFRRGFALDFLIADVVKCHWGMQTPELLADALMAALESSEICTAKEEAIYKMLAEYLSTTRELAKW
jgi:hypothetical protein